MASSENVTAWGAQAPEHGKVLLLPSQIETEQLIRICFIIFLFLLLSPVNVIAKEQLLAFQWAPELLFIQSSEYINGFFSWQHREDYTCIGLREKMVMPAVGVGSVTVKGVLETPLSLCTASKHGLDKDRSTACTDMARDSRHLVLSRHIHQTWSQAFEQMGEFSLALAWPCRGQNAGGSGSPPAQFLWKPALLKAWALLVWVPVWELNSLSKVSSWP